MLMLHVDIDIAVDFDIDLDDVECWLFEILSFLFFLGVPVGQLLFYEDPSDSSVAPAEDFPLTVPTSYKVIQT